MKSTLTTALAAAGIAIGALAVGSAALAQDYDSSDESTVEAPAEPVTGDAEPGVSDDGVEPIAADEIERSRADGRRGGPAGLVDGEGRGCSGGSLSTAAGIIGVDADELEAALESGQSIADVATSNGVDPQTVVDAMVERHSERLSEKVAAGELTEEEAAERLSEKVERAAARVNGDGGDADN